MRRSVRLHPDVHEGHEAHEGHEVLRQPPSVASKRLTWRREFFVPFVIFVIFVVFVVYTQMRISQMREA